ncbi:MAG: glycosyltransferase [Bacteroidetes bacterium]|nr:glycosyltransferase [Bacteroidota bacterium]
MKILIVTAFYAPFIHPRAHRWTALAEHWANEGHEVQVLTSRIRDKERFALQNGVQVHRTGFDSLKEVFYYYFGSRRARGRVGVLPQRPGLAARLAAWLYTACWKKVFFPDDACVWYFPARRKLLSLLQQQQPDLLITVSLPFTGHLVGLAAKRCYPQLHWLADIGDPFSFRIPPPNNLLFYDTRNKRLELQVLQLADTVSVTTEATRIKYAQQFGNQAVDKMCVIPPLYLPPATEIPAPAPPNPDGMIRIGYFGALYRPTRTPEAFFYLLRQLPDEWQQRLDIHFYGEVFPDIHDGFAPFPKIQLHGLQSREQVRAAMSSMDILLNIGNTTDFQLPSKAVDYLAAGKPVLNLSYSVSDPFADFFEGNDLIFNLSVENDRVQPEAVTRLLEWLEKPKILPETAELAQRMAPYGVGRVGESYLLSVIGY